MEIEFYDKDGSAPVREYMETLQRTGNNADVARILRFLELIESFGSNPRSPYSRIIDRTNRIFELRPGDHRIAYAIHDGRVVLLHAWRKQTQKLDEAEAAIARTRLADWKSR